MPDSKEKYEVIPPEMKSLKQWVIWGVSEEKPKSPYNPNTPSVGAKANDAATWADFETAVSAAARLGRGGIGFELGNGIAGIDLDHVINDDGEPCEFARTIVDTMNSYTEYSPSGRGLHILFRVSESEETLRHRLGGKLGGKNAQIELYFGVHYLTVTGRPYGEVKGLADRTQEALKIYSLYLAKTEKKSASQRAEYSPKVSKPHVSKPEDMSNSELWERMFNAPNGRYIQALYYGDTSGYGSNSEADLALCNHLAFWTGNDAGRMDMMFRESGLYRDKWDEQHGSQTYGEMTIAEAISGTPSYSSYSSYSGYSYSSTGRKEERQETPNGQAPSVDASQLKPVSERLNDYMEELLKSREGKAIPTGFEGLDRLLDGGLYPGLYFIGAKSSLGKTTLALQIADNIAKGGHGVLIFSLEMSTYELMAKTISRESLMLSLSGSGRRENALSTRGILRASWYGNPDQEGHILSVIDDYSEWGGNLTIIEGIGDVGVTEIKSYVEAYMKEHDGNAPVVVIDYLQILAPYNDRYTDKQNVDKNVLELKRLSRDYQLPVIGISSFNRENYNAPVSMASFKESGAIEYSSDVLIGLQVDGIERAPSEKDSEYKERIQRLLETVDACKRRGEPIAIEAKILKHRNGIPGSVYFEFYSRYNLFRERV